MTGCRLQVTTPNHDDPSSEFVEEYLVNVREPAAAEAALVAALELDDDAAVEVTSTTIVGLEFNNSGVPKGGFLRLSGKLAPKASA